MTSGTFGAGSFDGDGGCAAGLACGKTGNDAGSVVGDCLATAGVATCNGTAGGGGVTGRVGGTGFATTGVGVGVETVGAFQALTAAGVRSTGAAGGVARGETVELPGRVVNPAER